MPHFQIKDLGETSRKQNRVYIGECQRVTWGQSAGCVQDLGNHGHTQLPMVVRGVEVGVRRAAKGEGRKGC